MGKESEAHDPVIRHFWRRLEEPGRNLKKNYSNPENNDYLTSIYYNIL